MEGLVISVIVTGVVGLLIAALGLYMSLTGRGAFLVAGYNTMSKENKEKYDSKAICRFVGKFLIFIGLLSVLFAAGLILGSLFNTAILWIAIISYSVIVTAGSIYLAIILNTGARFRK